MEQADKNNEKLAKAKVIENMLAELNMSRQELIDLIKSLMEQSVSEVRSEGVSQNITVLELQKDSGDVNLPANMGLDELVAQVAGGNGEYLSKYLSLEQLKALSIRAGLAFSLKRAKELGIVPDMEKISMMLSIDAISRINDDGTVRANNRDQKLSEPQATKLNNNISSLINNRQLAGQMGQAERNQMAQLANDPNDISNQNSSVNVVKRVMSMVRSQVQALGVATGVVSPVMAAQQQQVNQIQNMANTAARISSHMRRHERNMKKILPELGKMTHRKGQTFATVRTKGGEREVNLKDYLSENKKLNPKTEKILNSFSQAGDKLELALDYLSKGLPSAKSFNFDASGKLQVVVDDENKQKTYLIADYINDLRRDIDRLRSKAETTKAELETKKGQIERALDLSRGPELDKSNINDGKAEILAAEILKHSQVAHSKSGLSTEKTETRESKRSQDELIKLDVMADRAKMMDSLKGTNEMRAIESSMKDVMKHMDEAQKNKDILDNLKKDMQKGKFLDK